MKQQTLSAGAVPVRKVDEKWEFLILRSFAYWDFPKGAVEENEDPWDGALREVTEETGLQNVKSPWGREFIETAPYGRGKVARYYLVEVSSQSQVRLEPNPVTGIIEHHEFRWLPYAEARKLLVSRVQAILDWAYEQLP